MIQCNNCGQFNDSGSTFCRFCGTRMAQVQNRQSPPPPEYNAPRPYVWKTDEFQTPESQSRKTGRINQVQPLVNQQNQPQRFSPPPQMMNNFAAPPVRYQQSSPAYGYRCPHCGTQNFPRIERKISTAGWITFAALLLFFFPLFWIGLLIKEDVKICSVCNFKVG